MVQIIVCGLGAPRVISLVDEPTTPRALCALLLGGGGGARVPLLLLSRGKPLDDDARVSPSEHPHLTAVVRGALLGGKGGFGANLRAQGRTGVKRATMDFGACRDLSGRRLKSVNEELRLRKWMSAGETARRAAAAAGGVEYTEAKGAHGISGWLLGVPAWAEGFSADGQTGREARLRPRKTTICRDWAEARAQGRRGAPLGAPRWWGCPRGRGCEFAHGEEELRAAGKIEAGAARKEAAAAEAAQRLARYTEGIYVYSAEGGANAKGSAPDMLGGVMAGLRELAGKGVAWTEVGAGALAGTKRRREGDEGGGEGEEDEALGISGGGAFFLRAGGVSSAAAAAAATAPPGGVASASPPSLVWQQDAWCALPEGQALAAGATVEYRSHGTTPLLAEAAGQVVPLHPAVGVRNAIAEVSGVGDFSTLLVPGVSCGSSGGASSFYYEVEAVTCTGVAQVGWAECRGEGLWAPLFDSGEGVGDDESSWSFDAARALKWHALSPAVEVGGGAGGGARGGAGGAVAGGGEEGEEEDVLAASLPFGRRWTEGSIVGCLLEVLPVGSCGAGGGSSPPDDATLVTVRLSFSLNGEALGEAFSFLRSTVLSAHLGTPLLRGFFPAVSLDAGEVVRLNLGQGGFAYPPSRGTRAVFEARTEGGATVQSAAPVPAPAAKSSAAPIPAPAVAAPAPITAAEEEPLCNIDALLDAASAEMRASGAAQLPLCTADLGEARVGLSALAVALRARGAKAGGTWEERAARLLAVAGALGRGMVLPSKHAAK